MRELIGNPLCRVCPCVCVSARARVHVSSTLLCFSSLLFVVVVTARLFVAATIFLFLSFLPLGKNFSRKSIARGESVGYRTTLRDRWWWYRAAGD